MAKNRRVSGCLRDVQAPPIQHSHSSRSWGTFLTECPADASPGSATPAPCQAPRGFRCLGDVVSLPARSMAEAVGGAAEGGGAEGDGSLGGYVFAVASEVAQPA